MTHLQNKNILITGAGGGFGQQFAVQLLAKDANLILTDLDEADLKKKGERWREQAGRGKVIKIIGSDLSDGNGVDALFQKIDDSQAPIDVLINNAGIGMAGRHDEIPRGEWERLMQVNLLAPMRLCALLAPQMIARQQGHIVNICSMAAWVNDVGLGAYSASKFGLRGFSEALAEELQPYNIKVSAVHPFYSKTPILNSPRYGQLAANLPDIEHDDLPPGVSDPADVIRETIKGIEEDRLHIFPDRMARLIYYFSRYRPGIFNILKRQLRPTT